MKTKSRNTHRNWKDRIIRLKTAGKYSQATRELDEIIENSLPLFQGIDSTINEDRRLAWLYRIHLLRENGRYSEALAWVCLECEINPKNIEDFCYWCFFASYENHAESQTQITQVPD